jgi:hypothetical protein
MSEWLEDHVAAIGPLNLNLGICGRFWLHWRSNGARRWKGETVGWEGQRVLCEKPVP